MMTFSKVDKMQNKFKNLTAALGATMLLTLPLSATAADYEVLGGTFFMAGVTGSPVEIKGDGSQAPLPGVPAVGIFSDGVFTSDYTCLGQDSSNPSRADQCETAGGPSGKNTGPDDNTASKNGLTSFLFFGAPVFTYFAATGGDTPSPKHPVPTINIAGGTADMSSFYANWNGTEFHQGSIDPDPANAKEHLTSVGAGCGTPTGSPDVESTNATVTPNGDGSYTVAWSSLIVCGPFNNFVGDWTMRICPAPCTLIPPAKAPSLESAQIGTPTRVAVKGVGDVVVTLNPSFNQAGINFDWADTDDVLDGGGANVGNSLTITQARIDAAGAVAGKSYPVILNITDTNFTPNRVATATLMIKIAAAASPAVPDSDYDGIPDAADSITNARTLQTDSTTETAYLMKSSTGVLKLGDVAFCAGNNSAGDITVADIGKYGGRNCAKTSNSVDNVGTVQVGVGGYYDFEIHDIDTGSTVDVVIPLKAALPVNASYKKFTFFSGWQAFDPTSGDSVMSAPGSPGDCPTSDDSSWEDGLIEGYYCMKISITDGGINDADRAADGIIKDPGGISSNPDVDPSLLQLGGSLSWPALAILAAWFGLARRKVRH